MLENHSNKLPPIIIVMEGDKILTKSSDLSLYMREND
jgi:hypothetical protein